MKIRNYLLLIFLLCMLTGCATPEISKEEYETHIEGLQHNISALESQINEQEVDIKKLLVENQTLTDDKEILQKEFNILIEELSTMKSKSESTINIAENYRDEEYFIPSSELAGELLDKALFIGDNFRLGNTLECDWSKVVEIDNYTYHLITEEGITNIKDLKLSFSKIYTIDAINHAFDSYPSTYRMLENKLYAFGGEMGSMALWNKELPQLVSMSLDGKELIYSIKVYDGSDDTLTNYEENLITYKFIDHIGWRVDTFVTH